MPATQHEHNSILYPEYIPPATKELFKNWKEFYSILNKYCASFKLSINDFLVDKALVYEAFIRVDQRKLHYKMYHNGTKIDELKEAALLCFWINHYRPIVKRKAAGADNKNVLHETGQWNAKFCFFLILSVIVEYNSRTGSPPTLSSDKRTMKDFIYTLANRQLSYDSLVMLVEVMAKMYTTPGI